MTDLPIRRTPTQRRTSLLGGAFLALASAFSVGCLDRPVVPQEPTTNNIFVEQVINTAIDKIDLLFVIDNSVSMADKQELLREAVPVMVSRLVTPDCLNSADDRVKPDPVSGCPDGYASEFEAIGDIHIGVITSSIGDFGANSRCTSGESVDKSLLVPKVRTGVVDPDGQGFLVWGGGGQSVADLETNFQKQVIGAGEDGCGFEAPLEAWYRFLVDASPPENLVVENDVARSTGVSTAILEQRAQFLRSDSLVAIVLLTDENDCSAMEGGAASVYPYSGYGYLIPRDVPMKVASTQCEENPNDACCYSCIQPVPSGCGESTCPPGPPSLAAHEDRANVRCFDNKRRFGIDLLYPTQRYVDGLSKSMVVDSQTGQQVPNPLLTGRQPDLIFFAGIIGVPWQDIATDESRDDPTTLKYLSAEELAQYDESIDGNRWDLILGKPGLSNDEPACWSAEPPETCGLKPVPPKDPMMVEQINPRSGVNPLTGEVAVQQGDSGSWSVVNGHEYNNAVPDTNGNPSSDDLQYSCIFKLTTPVDCTVDGVACDCTDKDLPKNSPLCKATPDAAADVGTTQYYGKAYPATRVLKVLRDFGENSIVGSICPKLLDDKNAPDYGYNPAINAIVDRLAEKLGGQCLPRELALEGEDGVPCTVIEAVPGEITCDPANGRKEVSEKIVPAVINQLEAAEICVREADGASSAVPCDQYNMCEILEVTDPDAQQECFGVGDVPAAAQDGGFCYIDPAKGPAAGGLGCSEDPATWDSCTNPNVDNCGATQKRLLRFVGQDTPAPNSVTFVACVGEAASAG